MGMHGMADELTSEEATERLGAIYSGSLEGEALEKRLASIPKILEKYEGKWPGLIRAAEKKYGKPEEVESEATEGEETQVGSESEEKPAKKRGGLFSRRRKPKEEAEEPQEADEEPEEPEEEPPDEKPAKKRGGLFSRIRKPKEEAEEADEEPEEEPQEADEEPQEADEEPETPFGKAARLLDEGNSEGALEVWKGLISSDGGNPEVWRGLASYFASAGRPGRAQACEEHADDLS